MPRKCKGHPKEDRGIHPPVPDEPLTLPPTIHRLTDEFVSGDAHGFEGRDDVRTLVQLVRAERERREPKSCTRLESVIADDRVGENLARSGEPCPKATLNRLGNIKRTLDCIDEVIGGLINFVGFIPLVRLFHWIAFLHLLAVGY